MESIDVTKQNLIHDNHTKFCESGCFLPYINKYSKTCSSSQMLVFFTCHHIIHSIRRVDKLKASIFKLSTYRNCKDFCTYLYITILTYLCRKSKSHIKEASILLECRLTTNMFAEQIPTRTQLFWLSFDREA
jgi:hypothetical protein